MSKTNQRIARFVSVLVIGLMSSAAMAEADVIAKGKELASDYNPVAIYERGGDEIAHSLVELHSGENLILAGNKDSNDNELFCDVVYSSNK